MGSQVPEQGRNAKPWRCKGILNLWMTREVPFRSILNSNVGPQISDLIFLKATESKVMAEVLKRGGMKCKAVLKTNQLGRDIEIFKGERLSFSSWDLQLGQWGWEWREKKKVKIKLRYYIAGAEPARRPMADQEPMEERNPGWRASCSEMIRGKVQAWFTRQRGEMGVEDKPCTLSNSQKFSNPQLGSKRKHHHVSNVNSPLRRVNLICLQRCSSIKNYIIWNFLQISNSFLKITKYPSLLYYITDPFHKVLIWKQFCCQLPTTQ